jgi:hypothetical protein
MTPTEFLQDRSIVAEDKTDLTIGFDNGVKESLIELLDSYHQDKLKLLGLHNVSNRRELLIDFAEKVYRRVFFTWDKKTSEKVVDEYIKGNL